MFYRFKYYYNQLMTLYVTVNSVTLHERLLLVNENIFAVKIEIKY